MYMTTKQKAPANSAKCEKCGSARLRYVSGVITCTNCDHVVYTNKRRNKYNASRATFKGIKYDSMFEAEVAAELEILVRSQAIKAYDRQFKVEIDVHRPDGVKALSVSHKVDFRLHHNDGSYELLEAKGVETDDYKHRRRLLELIWLPMHKDHTYTVRKQNNYYRGKR